MVWTIISIVDYFLCESIKDKMYKKNKNYLLDFRQIVLGDWRIGRNPDCESGKPGQRRGAKTCVYNVTRSVEKVIVHEGYNPSAALVTNDIALIRLDEPVPLYDEADEAGTRRDPKV